jgi:hypothetical protein
VPNSRCLYSINFATQLFDGRLGKLELSTTTVDLSVVSTNFFAYVDALTYMRFGCSGLARDVRVIFEVLLG